jgi:hypothetical protein
MALVIVSHIIFLPTRQKTRITSILLSRLYLHFSTILSKSMVMTVLNHILRRRGALFSMKYIQNDPNSLLINSILATYFTESTTFPSNVRFYNTKIYYCSNFSFSKFMFAHLVATLQHPCQVSRQLSDCGSDSHINMNITIAISGYPATHMQTSINHRLLALQLSGETLHEDLVIQTPQL